MFLKKTRRNSFLIASAAAAMAMTIGPGATAALAEDVTLSLRGGGLTVIGELIASDANSFVIKSAKFGIMALEASKFDCAGAACPKSNLKLAIHGSNTIGAQLMPATVERFAENEGYIIEKVMGNDPEEVRYRFSDAKGKEVATIDLHSHGTGTAVPGILKGVAQIGAMSRQIKPEEAKLLADAKIKTRATVFALDGVLVFVSKGNPIHVLSLDQIAKIFSGDIKDWSEVGGAPGPINVYARDAKSGTFDTFDSLVLAPRKLKISPTAKRFESSPDLSDEVSRDPRGIGFAGFAYLRNARALSISSDCGIISSPDIFSVKTEEYPLSRRLYLRTVENLPPLSQKLIEYAISDSAQETISEVGFIDQRLETQPFRAQAWRVAPALLVPDKEFNYPFMRELVTRIKDAVRLSISVRFEKNSAALDDKAQLDIPRIGRFLKTDAMKNKTVLILGFSDNTGTFPANRLVANNRAIAVKNALAAQGVPADKMQVWSYGNLMPAACNSSEPGRDLNRRVEIWLKD